MEQQEREQRGLREGAQKRAGQAAAQARAGLAMRGGLSSGARKRIATNMQSGLMDQYSDIARAGVGQRLGIQTEAEKQRERMLMGLPGMEQQALEPGFRKAGLLQNQYGQQMRADMSNRDAKQRAEAGNIAATLQERKRLDASALDKYREDMKAYGAERTAQATEDTGKK